MQLTVDKQQISNDRTIKNTFKLYDGNIIEGVLIPADDRMTACVSSQVGLFAYVQILRYWLYG
jgi:23S rRNA (adenine2503-C2)-methyltransferase